MFVRAQIAVGDQRSPTGLPLSVVQSSDSAIRGEWPNLTGWTITASLTMTDTAALIQEVTGSSKLMTATLTGSVVTPVMTGTTYPEIAITIPLTVTIQLMVGRDIYVIEVVGTSGSDVVTLATIYLSVIA